MRDAVKPMSPDQIQAALAAHLAWTYANERGGLIRRSFVFPDFKAAFTFMSQMAEFSETIQHHPEWFNVYNRVEVTLTTHDAGGLSEKDFQWARQADAVHGVHSASGGLA